jgi:hypothetical protein
MTPLPHRFNEQSFRRYEKIIAQITKEFPRAVFVQPSSLGLAGETVRGRLRDAITSYAIHSWPSTIVDREAFEKIEPSSLVVSLRPDGLVATGTRESIKSDDAEEFSVIDSTSHFDLTHRGMKDDKDFLCYLAHNQMLKRPVLISITDCQCVSFMELYDIVLTKQPCGNYLLI